MKDFGLFSIFNKFYLLTFKEKDEKKSAAALVVDWCRIHFFCWILLHKASVDSPTGVLHAYTVSYR